MKEVSSVVKSITEERMAREKKQNAHGSDWQIRA
jgi:hypothetical protein